MGAAWSVCARRLLMHERDLLVFSVLSRPEADGEAAMNDPYFDAPPTTDELVTVATYDDAVSANLALNFLRNAGLAAVVSDEQTVAMDWLLSNAIRGIKVQVNPNDAKIARGLIEEHDRLRAEEAAATGSLAEQKRAESVAGELSAGVPEEDPNDADQPDLEEEPPPTIRERDSLRALRSAPPGHPLPADRALRRLPGVQSIRFGGAARRALPQHGLRRGNHYADCPRRLLRLPSTSVGGRESHEQPIRSIAGVPGPSDGRRKPGRSSAIVPEA